MRVDTFYHPAWTIGGDFALVSPCNGEHLNLLVCDVSGHGISSALVANRIYTETVAHLRCGVVLADMLRYLNRFVIDHISSTGFFLRFRSKFAELEGGYNLNPGIWCSTK